MLERKQGDNTFEYCKECGSKFFLNRKTTVFDFL